MFEIDKTYLSTIVKNVFDKHLENDCWLKILIRYILPAQTEFISSIFLHTCIDCSNDFAKFGEIKISKRKYHLQDRRPSNQIRPT